MEAFEIKSYYKTYSNEKEIKIGTKHYFGELWDGDGDGEELLESGAICIGDDEDGLPIVAEFEIAEEAEEAAETVVVVVDIY